MNRRWIYNKVCLHDNVYIDDFEVINDSEDVLVTIRCYTCSQTQQHTICLENMLDDLHLGWEE